MKKLMKKILSITMCAALVPMSLPHITFAKSKQTFVAPATANHWGRSDIRSKLTGVEKIGNTLPVDTSATKYEAVLAGSYPTHFTKAEYDLVQSFTCKTNVFTDGKLSQTYETTDKFWLPSGRDGVGLDQVTSWGKDDISDGSVYSANVTEKKDANRLIPASYWVNKSGWLRSAWLKRGDGALVRCDGEGVGAWNVMDEHGVGPACKIDLSTVGFASVASAAKLTKGTGRAKIEVKNDNLGKKTTDATADYGMYLKTADDSGFFVSGVSFAAGRVQITYRGGNERRCLVVQAYKDAVAGDATVTYVAAVKLDSEEGGTVNVDGFTEKETSLEGYTIKVWMEEGRTASLAEATNPQTFVVGYAGVIPGAKGEGAKNTRVFAMKEDLRRSWGDLSNLEDVEYANILSGEGNSNGNGTDKLLQGVGPTNQKIYFGTDSSGNPLQFWIAGREDAANGGTIDSKGNIMTLCQAKSVDNSVFNGSMGDYDAANDAQLSINLDDNQSVTYTGADVYPVKDSYTVSYQDGTTMAQAVQGSGLSWQHREKDVNAWTVGLPKEAGDYEVQATNGTTTSNIVNFTITAKPLEGWGTIVNNNGIENYVDSDGKTSVEISDRNAADDGIIWLYEESDGTGAWYGIDNSKGTFLEGSRFWVRWLNKAESPVEWQKIYDQMDDAHKANIDDNNLWIFQVGVTDPDGNEYTDFNGTEVPLYIQLGDDWDKEDIVAIFVSDGADENVNVTYVDDMTYPSGADTFAKVILTHFSNYGIYDELTDAEKAELAAKNAAATQTGDNTESLAMMWTMLSFGAMLVILKRKKLEA